MCSAVLSVQEQRRTGRNCHIIMSVISEGEGEGVCSGVVIIMVVVACGATILHCHCHCYGMRGGARRLCRSGGSGTWGWDVASLWYERSTGMSHHSMRVVLVVVAQGWHKGQHHNATLCHHCCHGGGGVA